jgi:CheY-like chemotaxis protein
MLADDDRDDTDMFCEALTEIDKSIVCHCAVNGEALLKILYSLDQNPLLIFLDMNMPIMDGRECLKVLKSDERYRLIPVIMISTSSHQRDVEISLQLGALGYFVKPSDFNDLTDVLQIIKDNLGAGLKEALVNLHAKGNKHIFTSA